MAITRYVNTASTAGGDGTTNSTTGSTRAFASLAEAEATLPATLTDCYDIICEGATADTNKVVFSGSTTSASNYIQVRTTQAKRHAGKWDAGKYRLLGTISGYYYMIEIDEDFVYLDGLQIGLNGTSAYQDFCVYMNAAGATDCRLRSSIIANFATGTAQVQGICHAQGNLKLQNVIGYGFNLASDGMGYCYSTYSAGNVWIYNCTFYNNTTNVLCQYSVNAYVKNTVCQSPGAGGDFAGGNYDASCTNNLSSDTSAPGSNAQKSKTVSFVSTTAGSEDLHLQLGDTSAKSNGTDISSDTYWWGAALDIDGETRSNPWDVGADQHTSAASIYPDAWHPAIAQPFVQRSDVVGY